MNLADHREGNSGLAYLAKAVQDHSAPAPFERHLNFRLTQASAGAVSLAAEPVQAYGNPMGTLHGGYIATLLDTAMSTSVDSLLKPGQSFTTVELKVSFMRAVRLPGRRVHATGAVRKSGRRLAFAEGKVYGDDGELIATGSATCLIAGDGQ